MACTAMRFIACAGVLTTGLLMGGAGAGIAFADTGDAADGGSEPAAVTTISDDNSNSGASGGGNPDPPTSTVGNGREDVGVQSANDDKRETGLPGATTNKFKGSLIIPILRIPTLAELLAAMQPQPEPSPAPGPAFRTQEEAPPVADSGGGGGGGVDPLSVGVAAEPPVLQAPMVIAPLPIPLSPAKPPVAPLGAAAGSGSAGSGSAGSGSAGSGSAGSGPAPVIAADVAAAGAKAPVIRGSLQQTVEPASNPVTAMSGQTTPLGYPRSLRNPTTGELAVLALPGLTGLFVLTLSGGFIGYRQANAARYIRTQSAARFLR